jgi:hypothetical protein
MSRIEWRVVLSITSRYRRQPFNFSRSVPQRKSNEINVLLECDMPENVGMARQKFSSREELL